MAVALHHGAGVNALAAIPAASKFAHFQQVSAGVNIHGTHLLAASAGAALGFIRIAGVGNFHGCKQRILISRKGLGHAIGAGTAAKMVASGNQKYSNKGKQPLPHHQGGVPLAGFKAVQ